MNTGNKIIESMEFFDIDNRIQSALDHIGNEMERIESQREFALKHNETMSFQQSNNSWKSHYIISTILSEIQRTNEDLMDEVIMIVKKAQEKSASDECLATESDNA